MSSTNIPYLCKNCEHPIGHIGKMHGAILLFAGFSYFEEASGLCPACRAPVKWQTPAVSFERLRISAEKQGGVLYGAARLPTKRAAL
ncbi:MAG: hypothetical protein ACPG8W_22045 [Candidatus Promineifilaceae bacterium]